MSSSLIKKVCTKAQHQVSKDYNKSQKWLADHGGLTNLGEKIIKLRREKIAKTLKESGILDKKFASEKEMDITLENKLVNIDASGIKESPIIETPIAEENLIVNASVVQPEPKKVDCRDSKIDDTSEFEENKVLRDGEICWEESAASSIDARIEVAAAYLKEKKRGQIWDQIVASTSQPLAVREHYKEMNEKGDVMWEQTKKQS